MKSKGLMKTLFKWFRVFTVILLWVSFITTCSTMLFVSKLMEALEITLDAEKISYAAKLTFGNILILSVVFTVIDLVRRKLTVENPAKRILEAGEKIMQGDFSVQLMPLNRIAVDENFSRIVDCLNRMAKELSSVEILRSDFIANVSHEMKTPLTVIQNYGRLLQSPDLSEEERIEYAGCVIEVSRQMADMMTNILRLNRLENQQFYPMTTEFDLGEQLCECLLQYESVWEKSDIEIDTEIAENIRIRADAELLAPVWNNLFSNAFKFTPSGGKVSVSLTATEHHAIVQVRDSGCGMSPEVGAHIFEKFYQGDSAHATRGNGLGLALVKRVIDIIQGEITVESAVGKGTVFTVKIRRQ